MKTLISLLLLGGVIGLCYAAPLWTQPHKIDSLRQKLSKTTDQSQKTRLTIELASELSIKGLYEEAVRLAEQELIKIRNINKRQEVECLRIIGYASYCMGNHTKALDINFQAVRIAEKSGLDSALAHLLNNTGMVYNSQKMSDKAIEYFRKSFEISERINYQNSIMNNLGNLAIIYAEKKDYSKADEYFLKSYQIARQLKDSAKIFLTGMNIGISAMEQGKFKAAADYFDQALNYYKRNKNEAGLAAVYYNSGELYFNERRYDESKDKALRALGIFGRQHDTEGMSWSYDLLTRISEKLKDPAKALEYYKLYTAARDSLYNSENSRKLSEPERKYELEKMKELELLRIENEKMVQEKKARDQRTIWAVILIVSLFGVVILIFSRNNEINKRKLLEAENELKREKIAAAEEKARVIQEDSERLRVINLKLQESEEKLKQLNHQKTRLFSILAHDLKGPFQGLIGLPGLMLDHFDSFSAEEIREHISRIKQSANNVYNLLVNLLQWSRMQLDHVSFSPETLNLNARTAEVISLISESVRSKNIKVKNCVDETYTVQADPAMLQSVVQNLLTNAVKFTQAGGSIEITAVKLPEFVSICVKDNGVGMAPEDIEKIFRIDSAHTTKGTSGEKGTGLGLLICREMVEKHGGKISVRSIQGEGTEFTFTLPHNMEQNAGHVQGDLSKSPCPEIT